MKSILKFIEMILKFENDFEISEFYPVQTFQKSRKMVRFFENFRIFWKIIAGRAPAIRVLAREPG